MKVLHVIDSGGLYGAERVLLNLMSGLRKFSTECALASIGLPGEPVKPLEREVRRLGFDVRRVTMKAGADRGAGRKMAVEAADEGFHVLHTHGYKANILIGGLRRAARRLPVVATLHGWTSTSRLSKMRLYESLERFSLRRAQRVVAVSEVMAQRWHLRERYDQRLKIIPNGIEIKGGALSAPEMPDEIRSFVAGRRSILAAGPLSPEKGFDVLIDALALLRGDGLDACLVIAGEGDERGRLEATAAAHGVRDAVMMPGFLTDIAALSGQFELLAIPSRTEGLPVVLLEALLAGASVVATNVGEIPAVIACCGAGHCVSPDDPAGLSARLRELLLTPATREEGRAVAARAREAYSAEAMAWAYLRTYAEALPPL